jgi:hypothetical protein
VDVGCRASVAKVQSAAKEVVVERLVMTRRLVDVGCRASAAKGVKGVGCRASFASAAEVLGVERRLLRAWRLLGVERRLLREWWVLVVECRLLRDWWVLNVERLLQGSGGCWVSAKELVGLGRRVSVVLGDERLLRQLRREW